MSGRTLIETVKAYSFTTPYVLDVGDLFQGSISSSSDFDDYIGVRVERGQSYIVNMTPASSWWQGSLRLLEEDRGFITWGSPTGIGGTATLKFVADKTGVFHVAADLDSHGVGKYEVSFEVASSFAPWRLAEIADYLTVGYWLDADEPVAKWDFSDQDGAKVLTYDATALGDTGEAAAQQAFRAWTDVSGIEFVATMDAPDILFTQGGFRAFATHEFDDDVLTRVVINMHETGFEDQSGFLVEEHEVLLHEIGHALGLGHAGPYNVTGTYEVDALHAADTVRTSVMSYFRPDDQAFVDMFDDIVLTPMPADILAIQTLYGAVDMNIGDTVYGQNADISDISQLPTGLLGSYSAAFQNLLGEGEANLKRYTYAIQDDGGTDTIDYSRHNFGANIDLTIPEPGDVTTAERNIVLAQGTIIENAISGRYSDSIIGNAVANRLSGNSGDDTLEGRGGDDVLMGDAGDDLLMGGAGADALNGGSGDDMLFGDSQSRIIHSGDYQQIHRLYQTVLGRSPDKAGHEYWTEFLINDELSLYSIAQRFMRGVEFKQVYGDLSNEEFVTLLYANVLDRSPDPAGLMGWVNEVVASESRVGVVLGFSESAEFVLRAGAETSLVAHSKFSQAWTDDVFRLYQATLGRDPDMTGLTGWTNALADGTPFLDVISGFTNSAEFRATYGEVNDSTFIKLLYRNVLDREGSSSDTAAWLTILDDSQSREGIVSGFSQSREFQASMAASTVTWVRSKGWEDVLEGGAGVNDLVGGMMADRFIFGPTISDGNELVSLAEHTVHDLEQWDLLDFVAFGYSNKRDVFDRMTEVGNEVVFVDDTVTVVLKDTKLSDISNDMVSISSDDQFDI